MNVLKLSSGPDCFDFHESVHLYLVYVQVAMGLKDDVMNGERGKACIAGMTDRERGWEHEGAVRLASTTEKDQLLASAKHFLCHHLHAVN